MTIRLREAKPAAVPAEAKQAGEIDDRWSWVEPSVWTPRMLTALKQGVKGGKLAQRLFCHAWVVLACHCPCVVLSTLSEVRPLTGEPDAGDLHVRFGGRGSEANRLSLPLSVKSWSGQMQVTTEGLRACSRLFSFTISFLRGREICSHLRLHQFD